MTPEQIELAKRAVACKGWRWMRGMNTTTGDTFIAFADADEAYWLAHPDDPCEVDPVAGMIPDLSDPATLGCLLAVVRKAWGDPTLCVVLDTSDGRWCVERRCGDIRVFQYGTQGDTEAEALVAALEGAP